MTRYKIILVLILFIIVIAVILGMVNLSNTNNNLSGTFSSKNVNDLNTRISTVSKYIPPKSPILDAQYDIDYHDNSNGGVPGPSSWLIKAAIRVGKDQINKWDNYANSLTEQTFSNADDAKKYLEDVLSDLNIENWQLKSTPKIYANSSGSSKRAIFFDEGVIIIYDSKQ